MEKFIKLQKIITLFNLYHHGGKFVANMFVYLGIIFLTLIFLIQLLILILHTALYQALNYKLDMARSHFSSMYQTKINIVWFSNMSCGSCKTKLNRIGLSWTTVYTKYTHVKLVVLHCTNTWHHPGLSRKPGQDKNWERIDKHINKQIDTHVGVYRVGPASENSNPRNLNISSFIFLPPVPTIQSSCKQICSSQGHPTVRTEIVFPFHLFACEKYYSES